MEQSETPVIVWQKVSHVEEVAAGCVRPGAIWRERCASLMAEDVRGMPERNVDAVHEYIYFHANSSP